MSPVRIQSPAMTWPFTFVTQGFTQLGILCACAARHLSRSQSLCRDSVLSRSPDLGLQTSHCTAYSKWYNYNSPRKINLIIAAFYRAGLLSLKRPTIGQPGTGPNVLTELMKSTHRTQAVHDKNLFSCETRPSWEGVSSACLFICLFGCPRLGAGGIRGPTKVRCQRGEEKIEQSRTK